MTRRLRSAEIVDRLRTSLFFVPMAYVIAGIALGQAGLAFDDASYVDGRELPIGMTSTVDSARAVLTVVASATMTVAGIAFSVSLLILQLASSQYSPRIVHGLFRDPRNKQVMGIVLGTFTYCLVVLRGVHGRVEPGGEAAVPTLSVTMGVLFGIIAVVAIVAFIDHNAHAMDVSNLLAVTTQQAVEQARSAWGARDGNDRDRQPERAPDGRSPTEEREGAARPPGLDIPVARGGWVRHLDTDRMLEQLPPRTTLRCDVAVGDYVAPGRRLGVVWPAPGVDEELSERLGGVLSTGRARTVRHDPLYGVRQLVDVAQRALSSGINDPTTAEDAIVHLGELLHELLTRRPPPRLVEGAEGRRILLPRRAGHADVVRLAFDELHRDAASRPRIAVVVLDVMAAIADDVGGDVEARDVLVHQAHQVLAGARGQRLLPGDLDQVEHAHAAFRAAVSGAQAEPAPAALGDGRGERLTAAPD